MTRPSYTEDAARAAHCWFGVDRVPRDAETTAWKRLARFRQAQWREARGYPMGAHPHTGGEKATPVGSRLALQSAMESGANFVSPGALAAVRARLAQPERFEMLRADRLWADLLSSMPLCFNLFGDLALAEAARSRSQTVILNAETSETASEIVTRVGPGARGKNTKYLPYAFTEQGVSAEYELPAERQRLLRPPAIGLGCPARHLAGFATVGAEPGAVVDWPRSRRALTWHHEPARHRVLTDPSHVRVDAGLRGGVGQWSWGCLWVRLGRGATSS